MTNTRLTNFSRFGIIKTGVYADQVFGGPGDTLRPFVHGTPTGSSGVESGGDGTFYDSIASGKPAFDPGLCALRL